MSEEMVQLNEDVIKGQFLAQESKRAARKGQCAS